MKIKLCQCGNEIPRQINNQGKPRWNKYCSDECIKTYSNKNKLIPVYCPCGKEAVHKLTPKGKYKWNKYCSDDCRKIYYVHKNTIKLCLCGNNIPYKIRPNGQFYWNKYCSDKCRFFYRTGLNGKKKSAICIGCGEEFIRPDSYPSAMKYCSNKCSHKEVKSVRDKFVMELGDKAIVFHSMWEMKFISACDDYNIPWRRYDGEDIVTSAGNYRPDFFVGENDDIIEIKGRLTSEGLIKVKETKEFYGDKYFLIFEKQLQHFQKTGILIHSTPEDLIAQIINSN